MNLVTIPSAIIEDPPNFLFWEADEMVPAVVIFTVLYMWDMHLLAFSLPALFTWAFGRMKSTTMRGFLMHVCWWHGGLQMNKRFNSGLLRDVFE